MIRSRTRVYFRISVIAAAILVMIGHARAGSLAAAPAGFIEMKVESTFVDEKAGSNAVLLVDDLETVYLPIWIGPSEAMAIQLSLEKINPPRPLTHDLLKSAIEKLGATVVNVKINELVDDIFHARISIKTKSGAMVELDSRASDAIALALRCSAPIFVSNSVLKKAGISKSKSKSDI